MTSPLGTESETDYRRLQKLQGLRTPASTAPLPQGDGGACRQAVPIRSAELQAGLSALPAGGPPSLLSEFPRKQLTGLAVLFLEMFNRPSSGRGCR